MERKYIFVTGGVVSGLGKGVSAASLGLLLKERGLKVAAQKLDPYLNVDPGTMSPYQHGEVFVTEDGAETDLDLGHYERFIDENLNKMSNLTSGKVFWNILTRERRGEYLGKTVQIIPHVTDEIKRAIYSLGEMTEADVTRILTKILKELSDEKEMYLKGNNQTEVANCDAQIEVIKSYLPKMMSADEIREVISKLDDKSLKNIMITFKKEYAGKADMSLVSSIAKEFNH